MFARAVALLYGLACYLLSFIVTLYAMGFVIDFQVPKSIDGPGPVGELGPAILIDALLLALFAVQHSVMARPGFKRWWTTIVPPTCERSTYVLLSSMALGLVFWQWRPIPTTLWHVEGWAATVLTAIYWTGWAIAMASTHMIDHFELFGVRQVMDAWRGTPARATEFKTPLLYRLVRHPLMMGFMLVFWATPHMTAGHLLFSALITAYILAGIHFEERDLVALFGESYERYRRRVPMLFPRLLGSRGE